MDQFRTVELFIKVAETGSMRAAGDALGISKSVVSYEIKKLEDHLGARLFNRTTRNIVLTEAGARFLDRAQTLLRDWRDAERDVAEYHARPKGLLRVAASPMFGGQYVAPALVDFQALYPDIEIDLECSEGLVDVVKDGYDLAIRVTILPDSQLMRRQLAPNRLVLVAAPAYLDTFGTPMRPLDLATHRCLRHDAEWAYWSQWLAILPDHERPLELHAAMTLGSSLALLEAARSGGGIALLHTYVVGEAIARGELKALMPDRMLVHGAISAVFPHGQHMPAKTRLILDFLANRFKGTPSWEQSIFPVPAENCSTKDRPTSPAL